MKSFELILIACLLSGCSRKAELYSEGEGQAERDLGNGHTNVAVADAAYMPAFAEYTSMLRTRYHIGTTSFSLPSDTKAAEAWIQGYNNVAFREIERQFGTNILRQTMADAEKAHKVVPDK